MMRLMHWFGAFLFGLVFVVIPTQAQTAYGQPQLDQLVAPIALYPDPLLSQVLIASTYPSDVSEAAVFMQENPSLTGKKLSDALDERTWDPSVKYLTQTPDVLAMMRSQSIWTERLGDAFLNQEDDVMGTVQALRKKARARGTLIDNQQQRIQTQNGEIIIQPYTTDKIFVPYYDPNIVYGKWWWADNEPFVLVPPFEFQPPYFDNSFAVGVTFGLGAIIVDSLFFPIFPDWRNRHFVYGRWRNRPDWHADTRWQHKWKYRDDRRVIRNPNGPRVDRDPHHAPWRPPDKGYARPPEPTSPFDQRIQGSNPANRMQPGKEFVHGGSQGNAFDHSRQQDNRLQRGRPNRGDSHDGDRVRSFKPSGPEREIRSTPGRGHFERDEPGFNRNTRRR